MTDELPGADGGGWMEKLPNQVRNEILIEFVAAMTAHQKVKQIAQIGHMESTFASGTSPEAMAASFEAAAVNHREQSAAFAELSERFTRMAKMLREGL